MRFSTGGIPVRLLAFLFRPSVSRVDTLKCMYYIVLYSGVIRTKSCEEVFGPGPLGLLRKGAGIGQNGKGEMADCLFDGSLFGKNQRAYYSHVRAALPVFRLKRSEPAGMEEVHQGCLHGVIEVVSKGQDRASPLPGLGVQYPPAYVGAQAAGGTFLPHLDYAENGVQPDGKGDVQSATCEQILDVLIRPTYLILLPAIGRGRSHFDLAVAQRDLIAAQSDGVLPRA